MTSNVAAPRARELKGWHVLAMLLTFFGIVIAVDIGFSVIAVKTFPGEDEKRAYAQGVHFNDTLAARARQKALGWSAQAGFDEASVLVVLHDRAGKPLDGATVTGVLRRPTTNRDDRALTFTREGPGRYRAHLDALPAGIWDLRAQATLAEAHFEMEDRLTWPSPTQP